MAKKSLAERLKAEVAGAAAPSMIPVEVAPPPKKEEEEIPDIRGKMKPADRIKLLRLSKEAVQLKAQMSAAKRGLEGKRQELGGISLLDAIKEILDQYGIDGKGLVDDVILNYFCVPRSFLSEKLLMEHRVSIATIKACYETKDTWTLKMGVRGEEAE